MILIDTELGKVVRDDELKQNVASNAPYARWLEEHRIPAQPRSRRLRLDRERDADLPVWVFSAEDLTFDVVVLPHTALRQAPLSALDERPMRRASASQLRQLLAEEEIAGYEFPASR